MKYKKILVLAPHTDDAELGCGGTIAKFLEDGSKVFVAVFSTAEESVPEGSPLDILEKEFYRAMETMKIPKKNLFVYKYKVRKLSYYRQDILEEMVKLRSLIQPDLVLLPSGQDVHQDHQVIHSEGVRAFKNLSILGYELPWNHITFSTHSFMELEYRHIEAKWKALESYSSQIKLQKPYFTKEFIEGLAKVRGTQINKEWAEAFEVLRVHL
ncbi:PIG-L deacetylase family protein [Bacillus sp. DTU_2020_1000418_1_SI_GHA_SEK_038]|uniref:PIG-L deacetylase family protein n=1 Tax=Bacillus sp. DTU_2020_1000418_1_SI_GHA_SEK_038 TaxID=3077585 RepID=UPI0028EA41F6|nr:PIG-L deacetylase family protein [Bacillus sp. DTU_2020_1000418_1_SI_GHA_SEK_038]WNS74818.1 PIG-L deacetylase family protein [Bacillus sp. DTU_2020_1000418_1_SI_GHA_SEK_038]